MNRSDYAARAAQWEALAAETLSAVDKAGFEAAARVCRLYASSNVTPISDRQFERSVMDAETGARVVEAMGFDPRAYTYAAVPEREPAAVRKLELVDFSQYCDVNH